jgi:hypothetical protein
MHTRELKEGYPMQRSPFRTAGAFIVATALACAAPAAAQVTVYNNFGPGQGGWDYNWGIGWTVAGEDVPAQYGVEQAFSFVPSQSGALSDIWVAIWYVPLDTQPDVVTLRLVRNPSGLPPEPGDVLEEWTITEFDSWSQWNPPQHLVSAANPLLDAGQSYWLWAIGGPTTWCGWCHNEDPALTLPHTLRREGESWLPVSNETASVFRVDAMAATPVESATWGSVKALYR